MTFFRKLVMVDKPSLIWGRKDPVIDRRDRLVKNIRKQIEQLKNPKDNVRAWFSQVSDGYISAIKFFNQPLELAKGKQHFKVATKEALLEMYNAAIDAATKGEFDAIINKHMESRQPRGKGPSRAKKVA